MKTSFSNKILNHCFCNDGWVIKMLNKIFMNMLFYAKMNWLFVFVVVDVVFVIMKYEKSFSRVLFFCMLNPGGKFYGWANAWRCCFFFVLNIFFSIKFFGNSFWHYLRFEFFLCYYFFFFIYLSIFLRCYLLTYRVVFRFFLSFSLK